MTGPAALSLAYILDLVIGDPRQIPHPVKGIGWAITKTENILREKVASSEQRMQGTDNRVNRKKKISLNLTLIKKVKSEISEETREKVAGIMLVVTIAGLTFILFQIISTVLLEAKLTTVFSYVALVVYIYIVSTTIATRELLKSGKTVIDAVGMGRIEDAREKLSMIVGRDTKSLDNRRILKATIETLSESTSDGIIAPMFYFALGGLPLAMTYKAINTLDSMVGYKNEPYKNFGWASAKLDDIVNYIPARMTGILIVAATLTMSSFRLAKSEFSKCHEKVRSGSKFHITELLKNVRRNVRKPNFVDGMNAFKIMIRDGRNHTSPNSGVPEAAMAGALGIKLGGPSTYGGICVNKPYIGEEMKITGQKTVNMDVLYLKAGEEAVTITKITSFLGLLSSLGILSIKVAVWH